MRQLLIWTHVSYQPGPIACTSTCAPKEEEGPEEEEEGPSEALDILDDRSLSISNPTSMKLDNQLNKDKNTCIDPNKWKIKCLDILYVRRNYVRKFSLSSFSLSLSSLPSASPPNSQLQFTRLPFTSKYISKEPIRYNYIQALYSTMAPIAVVTGCNRGIGLTLVRHLKNAG